MEPYEKKAIIYYHRAYRKLPSSGLLYHLVEVIFLFVFFATVIFYLFPLITEWTSILAKYILSFVMPPNTLVIMKKDFLSRHFYIISRIGKFPEMYFLLFNIVITVIIAFLFSWARKIPKSISIWIIYICLLNLFSSFFFLYAPHMFPYDIETFSELYMKTQVTIWFFISLVIPLALTPFPTNIFFKSGIISLILLYSILFGCLRYIVFFYILTRYSYVFMPVLFFAVGPLMDFIYIIGLYSFFISRISLKMKGNLSQWQWSY